MPSFAFCTGPFVSVIGSTDEWRRFLFQCWEHIFVNKARVTQHLDRVTKTLKESLLSQHNEHFGRSPHVVDAYHFLNRRTVASLSLLAVLERGLLHSNTRAASDRRDS
eukprot:1227308-Amphidinium_carterae.2